MVLASRDDQIKRKTKEDWDLEFDAKDPSGNVKLIEERLKLSLDHDNKWREEARDDFKFALGDQWTDEEKTQLEEEGRPCLTFNKIESFIDLVGGWQRENSARIRVFPEGGEDKTFSEIGDRIIKAVDKWTKLDYKMSHQFDDGLVCGRGFIEMAIDYEEDPINGDLIFRNVPVWQVHIDPNRREYDLSDADYIVKTTMYTKRQLKKLFPKKKKKIDEFVQDNVDYLNQESVMKEGDSDNYHLGMESKEISDFDAATGGPDEEKRFMLKEHWYKEYVTVYYVYDVNKARLERFDTEEEATAKKNQIVQEYNERNAQAAQEYQQFQAVAGAAAQATGEQPGQVMPPEPEPIDIRVIERQGTQMWYAATAAGELLQEPVRSPLAPNYEGFPIFPYFAKEYVSSEDVVLSNKGITRNVKDAQKTLNKNKSQALHVVNTTANSGWIGDEDALRPEQWKDLAKIGSTPGVVIKKKPGSDLQRIPAMGPDMAHLINVDKAEEDIKSISGINSDAMAIQDKTTSGRAITLRIRQAMTILSKYFRNFRYTKELIGGAIFAMIPEIFDRASIRKVLGEEFMKTNGITDGEIDAFLVQIQDGKYDIQITEADNSMTIRQETFDGMLELVKAGMPVPPDLIMEYAPTPNSKELADKVKEFMAQQQQAQAGPAGPGAAPPQG